MPNDAKLGMAVGVGLVILIAILFFPANLTPASDPAATRAHQVPHAAGARAASPALSPVRSSHVESSQERASRKQGNAEDEIDELQGTLVGCEAVPESPTKAGPTRNP